MTRHLSHTQQDTIPKLYFQMEEVCEKLGVSAPTIRFYEAKFGLQQRRGGGRRRKYTAPEIERLRLLLRLCYWFHLDRAVEIYKAGNASLILLRLEPTRAPIYTRKRTLLKNHKSSVNPGALAKFRRMLQLLEYLKNGGSTVDQIAARLDVSPRTAYRYIQTIEEAGLPLEKGFNDRYFLQKD